MELDGIDVFVKVVQAGSFSGAAKLLGMPNSTVSAKIAGLEKRLGVTLLQRTTRKLRTTQAGAAYFEHCAQALEQLESAENEITSAQSEPQGELRVTAPSSVGHTLLVTLVRVYLQRYPKMRVDLTVTNRVVDLIAEGMDLAIRASKLADSRLIAKRFPVGHFGLWASVDYLDAHGAPSHPHELQRHRLLGFPLFRADRLQLTDGKENVQLNFPTRISADDLETLRAFAILGEGIAYLPAYLCGGETQDQRLRRVLPNWRGSPVTFSFVYPAQRFVAPKVRAFIAVAEKMFKR